MRAAIFIDGGYLLKQLQDAKIQPDYTRLAEFFLAPLRRHTQLDLMRCYFYYCPPWMSERPTESELRRMAAHDRFVADLQEGCDRWQVRLGKLERRRDGEKEVFAQKRVDVQLSVDLVHHTAAGHIQHAIVIAGDSDFIPAVVAAKQSGATLTLWCDRDRSVHKELMLHADEVHYIDWKRFPGRPVERPADRAENTEGERGDRDTAPAAAGAAHGEPAVAKRSSSRRGGGRRGRSGQPAPVQSAGQPAGAAALAPPPVAGNSQAIPGQNPEQVPPLSSLSPQSAPGAAPSGPTTTTANPALADRPAPGAGYAPSATPSQPSAAAPRPEAAPSATPASAGEPAAERSASAEPLPRQPAKRGSRAQAAPKAPGRTSTRQPPRAKDGAESNDAGTSPSPQRAPSRPARMPTATGAAEESRPATPGRGAPSATELPQGAKPLSEEPGDNIGNMRPGDDASAPGQKTSRRRRGGRGRRRKNGSSGTPPVAPAP